MLRLLLIGSISMALAWPVAVSAQNGDGDPSKDIHVPSRLDSPGRNDGLVIGLEMFAGNGLEADTHGAAGMGVHIGWMIRPTLALMLDTHGAAVGSSEIGATDVSSTVLVRSLAAAAVQWWPTRRFWLRGGLGPGRVEGMTTSVGFAPAAELEEVRHGIGATIATGFELYRGRRFALDLQARYAGIRAGGTGYSNIVAGLGFGWYPPALSSDGTLAEAKPNQKSATEEKVTESRNKSWRQSWVLGLGFLGGRPINNDCSDCYWDMGAGAAFQVGRMITNRLAVMLDTHAVAVGRSQIQGYDAEPNAMVQGVVAIAVQYWTGRRVWIKGGIGRGEVRESVTVTADNGATADIIETESGFGTLLAVGYELYQARTLGVNLHARYAGIHGDGLNRAGLVIGLGAAWFP